MHMRRRWAVAAASWLVGMAIVLPGCNFKSRQKAPPEPVVCLVGGTMLPAMEELAKLYEQSTGRHVQLETADSGQLLIRIETQKGGDLYVCHDPFLEVLMSRKLGSDGWCMAELSPVIVVAKGNPKKIAGVSDLAGQDISLVLPDYEYSTVGRLLPCIFKKAGVDFDKLKVDNVKKTVRSGSQAANDVGIGRYDAAIVWDAVARLRADTIDLVRIDPRHLPAVGDVVTDETGRQWTVQGPVKVTIATLAGSQRLEEARAFAEFTCTPAAAEVWRRLGYTPTQPRRLFTSGASLPAAQESPR